MEVFFNKQNKFKSFIILIGISILALLIAYIPFFIRGNYLVWSVKDGCDDGVTQGLTFLKHYKDVFWLKMVGKYDYTAGLGQDYLQTFTFFGFLDPYNCLLFIFPFNFRFSYSLIMSIKTISCSITMYVYLKNRKVSNFNAIILSIGYMLTGYTIFTFVRHYNLTNSAILLPLMIMGIENLYDGKRPYLLVAATFLCLLSNYYLFYFYSLYSGLYAILYHFNQTKINNENNTFKHFVKKMYKILLFYLLGVLIASIALLPNLDAYLNAARAESKGLKFFDLQYYMSTTLNIIFPLGNRFYTTIGLTIPVLMLFIMVVLNKKDNTRHFRQIVYFLTISLYISFFGYAFNLFNYVNNRWTYALNFSVFAAIGIDLTSPSEMTLEKSEKLKKTLYCYLVILSVFTTLYLVYNFVNYSSSIKILSIIAIISMIGLNTLLGTLIYKKVATGKFFMKLKPNCLLMASFILFILDATIFYTSYSRQFDSTDRYNSLYSECETEFSKMGLTGNRLDSELTASWYQSFENRGINSNYMSTRLYNSISNKYVYNFLAQNNVYNPCQTLGMQALDRRLALQSILSCKYYMTKDQGVYQSTSTTDLYQNPYSMDFGFMYYKKISNAFYDSLDSLSKQEALMNGIVIENDNTINGYYTSQIKYYKTVHHTLNPDETLNLTLDNLLNQEVYIELDQISKVSQKASLYVSDGSITREILLVPKGTNMYTSTVNYSLCFGVSQINCKNFTVSLKSNEDVSFDLRLATYDFDGFKAQYKALSNTDYLTDLKLTSDKISGKVTARYNGYLFLSLPYTNGFTAYVDGKKADILKANTGFMAIKVSEGSHDIELKYKTPFLDESIILSSIGIGILSLVVVYDIYKHKKNQKSKFNIQE